MGRGKPRSCRHGEARYPGHVETDEPLITRVRGVCGGDACFAGTRYAIHNLVLSQLGGMSDEEIISAYPHFTPAHLEAARRYYVGHKAEVDRSIRRQAA